MPRDAVDDPAVPQALDMMLAEVEAAPELYRPSAFWQDLNREHLAQLAGSGFENFKRSVNNRYFNWRILGIVRHQLFSVLRRWAAHPDWSVFSAEFPAPRTTGVAGATSFNPLAAWVYKTFVAMYDSVVSRQDPLGLLRALDEPELGNPYLIRHRRHATSQDLCNSVHEFYSMLGTKTPWDQAVPLDIAELGAGYGRVAHVCLTALPKASYTIIDLPPALYLSQRYLTTLFPSAPAFRFRPFSSYDDVREEFEASRIRFLLPHQLALLPPKRFDLVVNISSLHEMTAAQVANYFQQIDRLCRGRFYTKQWRVSRARANGCVLRERDYPVPSHWATVFQRRHPIQRMFFEALYEVAG